MGAARAPQAHVPRRAPGHQDGARLLRVRRDREEEAAIDDRSRATDAPDAIRTDTRKAALWATLAALAQLASAIVGPDPKAWYLTLTTIGFGLILPLIATLHLRQRAHRDSGATLATIAGTATVTIGVAASVSADLAAAELFVRGIWWWVVGKIWWETAALDRLLGALTMAFGALCVAVALASPPLGLALHAFWLPFRALLGMWLLAVAFDLLRGTMDR